MAKHIRCSKASPKNGFYSVSLSLELVPILKTDSWHINQQGTRYRSSYIQVALRADTLDYVGL